MTKMHQWQTEQIVSSAEAAIESNLVQGYNQNDPYTRAMLRLLSILDIRVSKRRLFHALPHAPTAVSIEDIRNVLKCLGIQTFDTRKRPETLQDLNGPAILVTSNGYPYIWNNHKSGQPLDPLTGQPGSPSTRSYTRFMIVEGFEQTSVDTWSTTRLRDLYPDIVRLLILKGCMTVISLIVALGVIAVYELVLPTNALDTLYFLASGLFLTLVLDYVFRRLKAKVNAEIAQRAEYVTSTAVFSKVFSLPLERLQSGTVSQQSSRMRQLMSFPASLTGPALDVASDIPFALALLIVLSFVSWQLALVPLCLIFCLVILALSSFSQLQRLENDARAKRSDSSRSLQHTIQCLRQIEADGQEASWLAESARHVRAAAAATQKVNVHQRRLDAISAAATPLTGGMLAVVGAYLAMQGIISPAILLAAMILSWRILSPIQAACQVGLRLADVKQRAQTLDRLMEMTSESDPTNFPLSSLKTHTILFRKVTCKYPNTSEPALRGLDIEIPSGAMVALTGKSTAGKTTFLRAISGLTPARSGRILIGGVNIRQIPTTSLRETIAYIPAEPFIIHGTIAQNLRLCAPDATESELRNICAQLNIDDEIGSLFDGFETRLTAKRQAALPGAFVRTLAIARAILSKPEVLLLDDPAQGMDNAREAALLNTLETLRGKCTIIMATHRPSHVYFAGYELRLNEGVIEQFAPKMRSDTNVA